MLQAYAEQAMTRDVIERFGTVQYRVVRRFARNALRSTGLPFSVNKQVKNLRSMGISVSTEKAYALLDDLEDAHLVFWVGDYNLSVRDNPRAVQKAYAVDPGLALAVAPASHLGMGQRLETVVFLELKRRYGMEREGVISSYYAEDVPEVDFVVGNTSLEEQYALVQVTEDIGDPSDNDFFYTIENNWQSLCRDIELGRVNPEKNIPQAIADIPRTCKGSTRRCPG